jgi:RNA polymerase sigma factor for flagellar operon FliA
MHEWLMDEQQENPSEVYEEKDLQTRLIEAIKALPEREQLVLSLYYFEELTFKEIGKTLDISESRVCQIHGRAVISLQSLMNGEQSSKKRGRPSKQDLAPQNDKNVNLPPQPARPTLDRYR